MLRSASSFATAACAPACRGGATHRHRRAPPRDADEDSLLASLGGIDLGKDLGGGVSNAALIRLVKLLCMSDAGKHGSQGLFAVASRKLACCTKVSSRQGGGRTRL